jgi:hypothetical protein
MNGLATAQLRAAVEFALRPDFVRIHGALIHPVGRIDRTIQLARHVNKESCSGWRTLKLARNRPTPLSRTRAESRPDFAVPGESPPIRKLPQNRCNVRVGDDPTGIAKSNALCCWSAQARALMVRLEKVFVTGSYTACQ